MLFRSGEVAYREGKDGINNLLGIYCSVTDRTLEQAQAEFAGKGYGDFKAAVGEAIVEELRPVQQKFAELSKDKEYIEGIYKKGADKAAYLANKTLRKVHKKIGFIER